MLRGLTFYTILMLLLTACTGCAQDKYSSEQVNETDETGSLHPKAPISAVPRHLIRENDDSDKLAQYIREFLEVNQQRIQAKKLLIDFRAGLAPFVTVACKNALNSASAESIEEVIIVTESASGPIEE